MTKIVLSVIIPTLNEATVLPGLLDALQSQTRPPDEIIVADAGSEDETRAVAQARGARVVQGGMPSVGRNAGAAVARGDLFLFLDADVMPPPNFIADALAEITESDCAVATCPAEPLSDDPATRILTEVANLFMQVVQDVVPHAPGFCIWVRREIHEAIGGFDEAAKMAEDDDYVRRAAKFGRFAVLHSVRIPVSMRRVEEEGLVKLSLKYLWTEMYALAGKPVYSTPFEYQFGAHKPREAAKSRWAIMDIAQLRQQLDKVENPLHQLSPAGLEQLERLLTWDNAESLRERVRLPLDPPDLEALHRFLQQRLQLIRPPEPPFREILTALQTRPDQESINLLDANWLRSQLSKMINEKSAKKEGEQE
ncbi:MAG: glycosyltransferase [Anaerolineae bacterium]|nr:glycosyltransferase [Anaerolineae bacterium]